MKKDNKEHKVVIRLSKNDYRKLDCMCYFNGKNLSEVMRDALDLYYETNKYK